MGLEGSMASMANIVLGFREEAWPKGHGYLYWRMGVGGQEIILCACDLYDVDDVAVSRLFEEALLKVVRKLAIRPSDVATLSVATENMSMLAQRLLRNAIDRMA